jgi:predicted ester cyclase
METNFEANKELAQRAWAAYDRGDEEAFGACLDVAWREYDLSGQSGSAKEVIASMKAHRVAFPDKHTEMIDIIAEGNRVVTNTITRATHTGPYLDLEPTGKRVVVYEICIHTICDGRVSKTVQAGCGPGMYEQLTGRPAPSGLDNMG